MSNLGKKTLKGNNDGNEYKNVFLRNRLIYLAIALGMSVIIAAASTYELQFGFNEKEMQILIRLVAILCIMICLKREKFPVEFNRKGAGKRELYAMGIVITFFVIAYYCPMDQPETFYPNGWLMAYALTTAFSDGLIFLTLGRFFFTRGKDSRVTIKDEIVTAVCFAIIQIASTLVNDGFDTFNAATGIVTAVGTAIFFTGIYYRYDILGSCIVIMFCVRYFPKVFALNSGFDGPVFKLWLTYALIVTAGLLMAIMGILAIRDFNREGTLERETEPVADSGIDGLLDEMSVAMNEANEKARKRVMDRHEKKIEKKLEKKKERDALKEEKKK